MSKISLPDMRKLLILVLGLASFLLIVTFVVVPLQGGAPYATPSNTTEYQETLPIQEVNIGEQGRSIFIAFVMLGHVLFANLHLGGSWVAAGSESLFLKTKMERYNRLSKSVTLFNVMLFSLGATFAIAGVLFFMSLFPVFATNLFHIYWWPLFFEALAFALEIVFLYTYWFSWDKISTRWHQVLGYGYAISVFVQTFLINMVAAGMLTPGGDTLPWTESGVITLPLDVLWSWWMNSTTLRLQFHRVFAAVSYFGFLLAMLAMFHYKDRKDDEASRKYWDWVGSYGIAWGLLGLIMQPVFGMIYMLAIFDSNEAAFLEIMHGPRAWEMLLMVGLYSVLMLTVIVYFISRRERILSLPENNMIQQLFKVFLIIAAIAALILVQPAWLGGPTIDDPMVWENPLGIMDYKYPSLFTLALIGALILMLDGIMLGDTKESEWGNLTDVSRYAGIMTGILGMWIVVNMGYVRESARDPWVIYGLIPVPAGETNPTPIWIGRIFIVWFLDLLVALAVFWFTSKVTAHHPEEAEEITASGEIRI
jgi:cytochrome d ubiquinol oxidase subunit I